eukprot:scaffold2028_cov181-Ochromonas_danica.AAC.9
MPPAILTTATSRAIYPNHHHHSSSTSSSSSTTPSSHVVNSSSGIGSSRQIVIDPAKVTSKQLRRLQLNHRIRLTFQRLAKDDLRRHLPTMYCNVINGGDADLLQDFFCQFMTVDGESDLTALHLLLPTPTATITTATAATTATTPRCEPIMPMMTVSMLRQNSCCGPIATARQIHTVLSSLPDHSFELSNSRIVRIVHEDVSVVELYGRMNGTRLIFPSSVDVKSEVVEVCLKISFYLNEDEKIVKILYEEINSTIPSLS